LASQPLLGLLSQLPKPLVQVPITQAFDAHAAVALVKLHVRPQAPQLDGSLRGSTQAPPQLVRGEAQVVAQVPPEHTCPLEHARPQAPQWALSVLRSRQVPLQSV
jgi:hypothetical protein